MEMQCSPPFCIFIHLWKTVFAAARAVLAMGGSRYCERPISVSAPLFRSVAFAVGLYAK